jgi:amidase
LNVMKSTALMAGPRISADLHQFVFDPNAASALEIDSGDTVLVETLDCFSNKITSASELFATDSDVLAHIGGRYNPVSAPIFVRGAKPGDMIAVEIQDIVVGARDAKAVTPIAGDWASEFGWEAGLPSPPAATLVASVCDGMLHIPFEGGTLTYPPRPMIGTIGTAPADEPASSLHYSPDHGGNLDCPEVRPGATVFLPVNVPGALLSLGDVHALMGDGEITGTALETSADVTIKVSVVPSKGEKFSFTPRLDRRNFIGSIGCTSTNSVDANIKSAIADMTLRLVHQFRMSVNDAVQIVNLFAKVTVNQSVHLGVNGWTSVLLTIPRLDQLFQVRR